MDAPDDRTVLSQAVHSSVTFRGSAWGIAGFALLILAGVLYLLLAWFSDGDDVASRLVNLGSRTSSLVWFVVIGVLVARALFAVAGSRIMQAAASRITGASRDREEWARAFRQLRQDFLGTPGDLLTLPIVFAIVLAGLLQLTRIPYAGRVFLLLLVPLLVFLAYAIVRPLLRWLVAGHLIGAGLATEPTNSFPAQSTAFAFLKRDPLRVIGLRIGTFLLALGAVLVRAAALVFLGLAMQFVAPGVLEGDLCRLSMVLGGWWLLSLLVAACYAGRVGQYVVLRRALDGVPLTELSRVVEASSLEQMGMELVKKLAATEEE